jgi:hypothetical protein
MSLVRYGGPRWLFRLRRISRDRLALEATASVTTLIVIAECVVAGGGDPGSGGAARQAVQGTPAHSPWPKYSHAKVLRYHPKMTNYEFLRRLA